MKKLIAISLAPDHPGTWVEGAVAAQRACDDAFTPRLIAIANDVQSNARFQAIFALAMNRNDASVAALKLLLADQTVPPHSAQTIAHMAGSAISTAYQYRGESDGRKLRPDDFDPEYQQGP